MKQVVFLGDGMADLPFEGLGGKTPLDCAAHPAMDALARGGLLGLAKTVPDGMPAGSDVANLSVFGYDPRQYYTGRSPLEAASIGIELAPGDVTYRCNFVTLSQAPCLEDAVMDDYSAGEISTEEARELVSFLNTRFETDADCLYPGFSYRHCFVRRNAADGAVLTPPHDISGKPVREHLPHGENAAELLALMRWSFERLRDHPVNRARVARGLPPASCAWFWGEGRRPALTPFAEKFGLRGSVISAVDLIQGIGKCAGLRVLHVPGATGNYHTDFAAKGAAAIEALRGGDDFVYLHVEAPDECGHRREVREKVWSIEQIDRHIIAPVMRWLEACGEDYAVLLLPDHPTPLALMTHTAQPVPFVLYRKAGCGNGGSAFTEVCAAQTGLYVEHAHELMRLLCGSHGKEFPCALHFPSSVK